MCCDWHLGLNDSLLNFVRPSLIPVVYGQTKILPDSLVNLDECLKKCGKGFMLDVPNSHEAHLVTVHENHWDPFIKWEDMNDPYSYKFQWLPCEIEFECDKVEYC